MYKYLPDSWVDFYEKAERENYVGKVSKWFSQEEYKVNKARVLASLSETLEHFNKNGGDASEFGEITDQNFELKTPICHEDIDSNDIVVELNPLVFVCESCKKVKSFRTSDEYYRNKKCSCGGRLSQIQLVYSCECGWSEGVTLLPCNNKDHGFSEIKYFRDFKFTCGKCGNKREIIKKCPYCGKYPIYSRNALDQRHFLPVSSTLVDVTNEKEERLISEQDDLTRLMLGWWFGIVSTNEYNELLENIEQSGDLEDNPIYQAVYSVLIDSGISKEKAREAALTKARESTGANIFDDINEVIEENISNFDKDHLRITATSIMEYKNILESKSKITLKDAQNKAFDNNFISSKSHYEEINKKYGISISQVSVGVPLVSCSLGYTRVSSDPSHDGKPVKIKPFYEKSKRSIYANKIETEGILFQFDRSKILEWLIENEILDENIAPNISDDRRVRGWFLDNIKPRITTFEDLNSDVDTKYRYTSEVYTLIHSISHAIINEIGTLCGLDKNSLSEYIFPNIPAVFIYCQNSQGLNLGSIQNVFENNYHIIFNKVMNKISKCIFDPICIEDKGACLGCLYINEISCTNFNKNLNRKLLIGYQNSTTPNEYFKGFWE